MLPPEVEMESNTCPFGCPPDEESVLIGRDRLHNLPGEFTVVRCRTCGLMRTNPRPTSETIGFYYPDNYGPYVGTQIDTSQSKQVLRPRPLWKRLLKPLIRFNTTVLPDMPCGRLLEVGCASGSFMYRMAKKGWGVAGIEFSKKAGNAARFLGYPVHIGTLEEAPDPEEQYDLVVGWMVLEHLHDPVHALKKLYCWTKPGGWLAVSVPNVASLEFRLFKDGWYALHLPNHLYHFTPKTITILLEQSGWQVEKIFHQRVLSNLVASIGYKLEGVRSLAALSRLLIEFPEKPGLLNKTLYPLAHVMSLIGQTGRMTIWARRL